MSKIRYLLDEHLPIALRPAVLRYDSAIDILRVGMSGIPPLGTLDPDILRFCEAAHRILVTENRRSMGQHITDHYFAGGQHWGIFEIVPDTLTIGRVAELQKRREKPLSFKRGMKAPSQDATLVRRSGCNDELSGKQPFADMSGKEGAKARGFPPNDHS